MPAPAAGQAAGGRSEEGECATPVPTSAASFHALSAAVTPPSSSSAPATSNTATTATTLPSTASSAPSAAALAVGARTPPQQTFFSQLPHKFSQALPEDAATGAIPTLAFLQACRGIPAFLDVLGSTAFAPVKSDINGNIGKLTARLQEDPLQNATLQGMVRLEIMKRTTTAKNSATDALLWLKRALEFISVFLSEVAEANDESLSGPATKAYAQTLSRFHGWMVRGIFNLAMKSVPYRSDFLKSLGPAPSDAVLADMREFTVTLSSLLANLATFYSEHNLDKA